MIGVGDVVRREDRLRQLELRITRKLDGLLHGEFQGLVPGGGTDPADGRMYTPGDDVRRMDWNLTARTNEPHIRTTIADRELETWLVLDASASLDFGTAECEKRDLVIAAAATFALLTVRGGNRIGALVFGSDGSRVLPPRGGRNAAMALLHTLEQRGRASEGSGAAMLGDSLRRVQLAARRRGLVVVISDLLDQSDWERALRALAQRHDVVVVQVRDPRESDIPPVGLLTLVDPETGERLEVHTNAKLRARFAAAAREQQETTARAIRRAGAAHLVLDTNRDWIKDVVSFVVARRRRR